MIKEPCAGYWWVQRADGRRMIVTVHDNMGKKSVEFFGGRCNHGLGEFKRNFKFLAHVREVYVEEPPGQAQSLARLLRAMAKATGYAAGHDVIFREAANLIDPMPTFEQISRVKAEMRLSEVRFEDVECDAAARGEQFCHWPSCECERKQHASGSDDVSRGRRAAKEIAKDGKRSAPRKARARSSR